MKNYSKDLAHYLPLLGIFILAILGFVFFSFDQAFQVSIMIASAVAYVTWGVIHHLIHRDLYLSVLIEYIVVAILGLAVVFSLIFNM